MLSTFKNPTKHLWKSDSQFLQLDPTCLMEIAASVPHMGTVKTVKCLTKIRGGVQVPKKKVSSSLNT